MPRPATLEERVDWHIQHENACACRQMPASIRREADRRQEMAIQDS